MKNGETFGELERGLANETLRSLSGLAELANRARKIANVFLSCFCVLWSLGEVGGWGRGADVEDEATIVGVLLC